MSTDKIEHPLSHGLREAASRGRLAFESERKGDPLIPVWMGPHICDLGADELDRQAAEIARLRLEVEALRRLETLAPEIIPALEATGVNVSLAADVRKAANAARNLPDPGTG